MMTDPLLAVYFSFQYSLPVSGSNPLSELGPTAMSCRLPPAVMIVTGEYPNPVGSDSVPDFQISLPVVLSNATTWLPSPPTRVISLSPSMNGWAAYPHSGDFVL